MLVIEIPPNPNCEAIELRVFHDLEPPRPVRQVRVDREGHGAQWCAVTGWTVRSEPSPALAVKVDDSGEGVAWLVYGGDAGLRLHPSHAPSSWRLHDARQWGLPFLLTADPADLRLLQPAENS